MNLILYICHNKMGFKPHVVLCCVTSDVGITDPLQSSVNECLINGASVKICINEAKSLFD